MKAYTSLKQSKKLAEILPLDTADMCYRIVAYNPNDTHEYQPYCFIGTLESDIPCWSLAALLKVLSETARNIDEDGFVDISSYKNIEWDISLINCDIGNITSNELIDACVELIVKLKEKNLI